MTEAKEEEKEKKITINDISLSTWFIMNGIIPEFVFEGKEVVCAFPNTSGLRSLYNEFKGNPSVPLSEYLKAEDRLKKKILFLTSAGKTSKGYQKCFLEIFDEALDEFEKWLNCKKSQGNI